MIHLDTNYLIGLLVAGSAPAADVDKWLAAELFNKTGRRRGSRFDCFIAAAAIIAQAELATMNVSDFKAFVPHGLKLV